MNRLSTEKRALILQLLTEGMGINSTTRIVGCSKNTTPKLLKDAAIACAEYQDRTLRDLECRRFQVDEIWSFIYAKKKTQTANPDAGDIWTWIAICNDSKLVPSWWIGDRTYDSGLPFMRDLASRVAHPIELTSDGLDAYLDAVDDAFDDGMVEHRILKRKYPKATTARTSYVERQNLTLRMSNRRYARKTNAFSKKLINHAYSMSLHIMNYNFARPHQTLKGRTPAQTAGITDRRWDYTDIIRLINDGGVSHPRATVQECGQTPNKTANKPQPHAASLFPN